MVTEVTPPGASYTYLSGINDLGTIVGYYYDASFNQTSFVDSKGILTTIAVPGGSGTTARLIAKHGEVLGTYYDANNQQDVFVATKTK